MLVEVCVVFQISPPSVNVFLLSLSAFVIAWNKGSTALLLQISQSAFFGTEMLFRAELREALAIRQQMILQTNCEALLHQ